MGMSGGIPDDIYLRKIEVSNFDEDPMMHENYARSQLADFRPDEAVLASDIHRSDNHSGEYLSMRTCGARSEIDPWLPEGSFYDHEFLERDSRGVYNDPNLNQFREQTKQRMAYVSFGKDADYSVPESAINPVQMRQLIRDNQYEYANRAQIFDESFDARATAATVPVAPRSRAGLTEASGLILNIAEATAANRQDFTDRTSNKITGLLRWTTPDHRIKVSKYGDIRPMLDINSVTWNTNRSNVYLDHQRVAQFQDKIINRQLAALISDIEGIQATRQVVAQGTEYGESRTSQRRGRRKLDPDDLQKLVMMGSASKSAAEVADLEGGQADGASMRRGAPGLSDSRAAMRQVMVNAALADSMQQVNKAIQPSDRGDVRQAVAESAANLALFIEQDAKGQPVPVVNHHVRRESMDTRHIEESRTVKSYSGLKPRIASNTLGMLEENRARSMEAKIRRRVERAKHRTASDVIVDADMSEFADDQDPREKFKPGSRKQRSAFDMVFDKSSSTGAGKSLVDIVLGR
jgi:hypothetical protein